MAHKDLDAVVLSVLKRNPADPGEIVVKVQAKRPGTTDTMVLECMLRLIDRQKAALTTDRRVVLAA